MGNLHRIRFNSEKQAGNWQININSNQPYTLKITGRIGYMFIYYKSLLYKCQKWFRFNEFLPCMCISCKSVFTVNACFSRPEYNYLYLWLCGKLCWTSPRLRSAQWASTRRYSTTIKQFYSFTVEGNFINLTLYCFKRFIFSKKKCAPHPTNRVTFDILTALHITYLYYNTSNKCS